MRKGYIYTLMQKLERDSKNEVDLKNAKNFS